jgi:hypothetical protein
MISSRISSSAEPEERSKSVDENEDRDDENEYHNPEKRIFVETLSELEFHFVLLSSYRDTNAFSPSAKIRTS